MRRLFLILLLSALCYGQGARIGDMAPAMTTSTVLNTSVLAPISGAQVNICTYPATSVPCLNKATTYTDSTLSTPCSTSTQVVLAGTTSCVAAADSRGNWGAWVAQGTYDYTLTTAGGANYGPFTITAAASNVLSGSLGELVDTSYTNDGTTGTFANLLAKISGTTIVRSATTDTAVPVYPTLASVSASCAAGTTGKGCLVIYGRAPCQFDAAGATKGDFVGQSTATNGRCMDLGASYPAGACWVGQATATVGANAIGTITVQPACSLAPAGYASFYDSGVLQPQRTKIDCLGGITCPDDAGNTWTQVKLASPLIPPNGTAAAPTYAFAGATACGWYRFGATTWGFGCGGSLIAVLAETGGIADLALIPGSIFAWCSDGTCSATDTNLSRASAAKVCSDKSSIADCQGTLGAAIVQPTGLAFGAGLPADANGSIRYCTDCQIANPCSAGGSGAIAKRLNGAWVCN